MANEIENFKTYLARHKGELLALGGFAMTMACSRLTPTGVRAADVSATPSRTSTAVDTHTPTATSSPTATASPDVQATVLNRASQAAKTAEAKPTATPDSSPSSTVTKAPAPTASATPSATPGPTQQVGEVAGYEAGPNDAGFQKDGILGSVDLNRFKSYLLNFEDQFKLFPDQAVLQNYAQAMQESPLKDLNGDGKVDLPKDRFPDFWTKMGGLDFTSDVVTRQGVTETLQANFQDFFTKGTDGYYRARFFAPEDELGKIILQGLRAGAADRQQSLDYTKFGPGTALDVNDAVIRRTFNNVIVDNGLKTSDVIAWPGATDLISATQILNSNVTVWVGDRPKVSDEDRSKQLPEGFRCFTYKTGLEKNSPIDDESWNTADDKSAVEVTIVYNPSNPIFEDSFRVDIFSVDAPQDPLRPDLSKNLSTILDTSEVYLQVEEGRWVKPDCNNNVVPENTQPAVAETDTPKPADTPNKPGETPKPHDTPTNVPATETPKPGETPNPSRTPEIPTETPTEIAVPSPTRTQPATPTAPPTGTAQPDEPTKTSVAPPSQALTPTRPAPLTPTPTPHLPTATVLPQGTPTQLQ